MSQNLEQSCILSQAYVCDYVLTDPLDPHFQEVTSHLALYTMQIDGARKLYRHFIKRPDGCIVEVFGDVGRHARSAVGVNVLPLGVTTEVEAIVELFE